ncbi:hypothetical protein AVEN_55005-1 [Araneus ventricosus]|uniref:DUF4817 domain-containing protein n=1 Tax=Araneus ventricosus TaxID=182803 RepID=A0A4Y2JZG3_ARAVE|nr:hypothetical protein AVEN_55005-1 [Araneus ventricosus]
MRELNLPQREIPKASVKMATVQQKTRLWFHGSKSVVTVQRNFRLEYLNGRSSSKNSIQCWYGQLSGSESLLHWCAFPVSFDFSYQRLMKFLLGDWQFRSSNRIILRTVTIDSLSCNQRRAYCCTVAILTLPLDCADLVGRNGELSIFLSYSHFKKTKLLY